MVTTLFDLAVVDAERQLGAEPVVNVDVMMPEIVHHPAAAPYRLQPAVMRLLRQNGAHACGRLEKRFGFGGEQEIMMLRIIRCQRRHEGTAVISQASAVLKGPLSVETDVQSK